MQEILKSIKVKYRNNLNEINNDINNDIIQYFINYGIISLGDIRNLEMEDLMDKILRKVHKYSIKQLNDGRWTTYISDSSRPNGRRQVRKKTKTELNCFLLEFYHLTSSGSIMTYNELFSEWVNYKKQFVSAKNRKRSLSPSTIRRYERDYSNYICKSR